MLFVINFTPVERPDYRVGVPKHKTYQLVLDSEDPKFTGKTVQEPVKKAAKGRGKAAKQSYKKLDYRQSNQSVTADHFHLLIHLRLTELLYLNTNIPVNSRVKDRANLRRGLYFCVLYVDI